MIIRSRTPGEGWLDFLRRRKSHRVRPGPCLDESQFALAVEKERTRAERRDLSFAILLIHWPACKDQRGADRRVYKFFRQRLRLIDELGYFDGQLAVLLPETSLQGAESVAEDLTRIGIRQNGRIEFEILVYPGNEEDLTNDSNAVDVDGHSQANGHQDPNHSPETAGKGTGNQSTQFVRPDSASGDRTQTRYKVSPFRFEQSTPAWKRLLDLAGALGGLVCLSPVMIAAAMLIKLTSPGPVIFRQWREGKDGRLFQIYKFRTMRMGAEHQRGDFRAMNERDGPVFKMSDDPRMTRLGRFLRRSCIDELPQFLNVIKGEMSLVGPRPLPADESLGCTAWQRRRLEVLPGMTCIWQVNGRHNIPFDEWMRLDLRYIRRRSLFGDLKLLARTAVVSLMHRGSV